MNKKLIALAVAAVASTSVSAAEIFNDGTSSMAIGGRAEARASIVDGDMSDASRVRLNFLGTTQIAEGLYGVGFFEREFSADETSDENRYVYAGIGTDFGLVTYGLNDGSLGMITNFTDIMSFHGAAASGKLTVADRTSNNMTYVGEFDGLTVKANYVGENDDVLKGYSMGAVYAMDNGLSMGLGYAAQDTLNKTKKTDADQIEAAVSYAFGDFYVAALYNTGENAKADVDGYEVAAAYSMGKTTFTTTYGAGETKEAGKQTGDVNALAIDATHFFNDNFRAYASYNFNMADEKIVGKAKSEDELALGLRYDF